MRASGWYTSLESWLGVGSPGERQPWTADLERLYAFLATLAAIAVFHFSPHIWPLATLEAIAAGRFCYLLIADRL